MEKRNSNNHYIPFFFWGMILGFLCLVLFIVISSRLTSNEFPDLTIDDGINDFVSELKIQRGSVYVVFENGLKYHMVSSRNFTYNNEFSDLAGLISHGDRIFKKSNSDTLEVFHKNRKYIFRLGQTIE